MTPNFLHGLLSLNRELLDQVVLGDSGSIKAYVDLNALHSSHNRLVSGGKVKDEDIMAVWRAVTLALWLRYTGMTP